MKVIDLLNKIANGEEVPKKIKYKGSIYTYLEQEGNKIYQYEDYNAVLDIQCFEKLNDEVEIIEEQQEDNFTGFKMFQNGKCFLSVDANQEVKFFGEE